MFCKQCRTVYYKTIQFYTSTLNSAKSLGITVHTNEWMLCLLNQKNISCRLAGGADKPLKSQKPGCACTNTYKQLTVFPDPVWAHAIKSRPASIIGILYFCTGVSFEYPALAMFLFNVWQRLASSKV